jgi:hypothetical protein
MQLNVEKAKLIWAAEPKNYTGAAMAAKYVSLKTVGQLTIIIQTGAWAAGTAAVTLLQATAVAGTGAKALGFAFQWNDVATSGTLVQTAVVADTFTIGVANKLYVIEVDPRSLDIQGGFDCVTLAVASPGVNADFYSVVYMCTDLRYQEATPPSVLVD